MVYDITIATSAVGLAVPMLAPPQGIKRISPEQIITASGIRVLNGLGSWELYWKIVDPADTDDIFDRTGGSSASSIAGYIRIQDWVLRSSSVPTYSDYSCFLDQPVEGDFQVGHNRYNLKVAARQLVVVENLA